MAWSRCAWAGAWARPAFSSACNSQQRTKEKLKMATEALRAPEMQSPIVAAKGGSFLVEDRTPEEIFTPEDMTEEQRMIGKTTADWMDKDVLPKLPEILKLNYETIRAAMSKAGELGLLG